DDANANLLGVIGDLGLDRVHYVAAFTGDDFAYGALGDFLVQRRLDRLRQPIVGTLFVATEADKEQARIDDPVLHERVDQDVLLLGRDETVCVWRIERQNPLVEKNDVLER